MKTLRLLLVASLFLPGLGRTEDQTVMMEFSPRSDLRGVLAFYERLSKRTVWVNYIVRLDHPVVLQTKIIPIPEATALIRSTFLDRYGIEIREDEEGKAFLQYSQKPEHMKLWAQPVTGVDTYVPHPWQSQFSGSGRQRIRVIDPSSEVGK